MTPIPQLFFGSNPKFENIGTLVSSLLPNLLVGAGVIFFFLILITQYQLFFTGYYYPAFTLWFWQRNNPYALVVVVRYIQSSTGELLEQHIAYADFPARLAQQHAENRKHVFLRKFARQCRPYMRRFGFDNFWYHAATAVPGACWL